MSLPREWNLQDSRGSLYCPSEPDPIGRIQYQSGRFIRSSTGSSGIGGSGIVGGGSCSGAASITSTNATGDDCATPTLLQHIGALDKCSDFPHMVACSQPAPPSLLTECQQSTGSLFSVVSAPPVSLAELDVKQVETLQCGTGSSVCNGLGGQLGLQSGVGLLGGYAMGGSAQNPFTSALLQSTTSIDTAATVTGATPTTAMLQQQQQQLQQQQQQQRRPATLTIDRPYSPAANIGAPSTTGRTLHSSLLEHQISEIEEDDNENLLTVSSITARPLIAKSRELRTNRQLQQAEKSARRGGKASSRKPSFDVASTSGGGGGGTGATRGGGATRESSANAASSSRSSVSGAEPPDGGYGWVIVFGAFSVQFWVAGLVKSYGVLYVEIMETFPSSTATVASWIPAILSALCLALAPLSSALCQRFSCRTVVFIGGLFCALGLALSYFATSLLHLLFTFGILTGIGGGLSTTPGIVIVSQYFDKHRALANGICVSGTAAGSFILPVLIKHLAEKFGFHGTILILGGCMLDVCISATLYKPLEEYSNDAHKTTDEEEDATRPLNDINPSTTGMLTNSTYLDTCDDGLNTKFIEHLFLEESKNRLNDYYSANKSGVNHENTQPPQSALESDDEVKDIIGESTFIKPMKKVRSSGIMHSVEDLSTDSTWVYRKHSGTDSNRGSRRRRNVFANDEIISKIQAHLEKPLSPPAPPPTAAAAAAVVVSPRGLSKSMEIPTPVSNLGELKKSDDVAVQLEPHADDDEEDDMPRTCIERIEMYLDISLLKDPTFILMCLSVTLMSVGCPYMLYYLPAHVLSIGYDKSEAGYLVAVSAVLDLIGRLGLGWLSDLQLFDRRKTYVVCILGAGVAVLTIPSNRELYLIGISAAVYGLCLGSWYVLMPVLLADIFGTDRISSSYGLVRMFQSIGAISVPPLAGFLRDLSGSYEIVFYCMGSCMVMGCIPLLVWALLENRERRLFNNREDSDENSTVS